MSVSNLQPPYVPRTHTCCTNIFIAPHDLTAPFQPGPAGAISRPGHLSLHSSHVLAAGAAISVSPHPYPGRCLHLPPGIRARRSPHELAAAVAMWVPLQPSLRRQSRSRGFKYGGKNAVSLSYLLLLNSVWTVSLQPSTRCSRSHERTGRRLS